jgi:hypothetical protein
MDIRDVVDEYLKYININIHDAWYDFVSYIESSRIGTSTTSEEKYIGDFDFIFGNTKKSLNTTRIKYASYDVDATLLSGTAGCSLYGGSDGSFEGITFDTDTFKCNDSGVIARYVSAYTGVIDDRIFDEVRYPISLVPAPMAETSIVGAIHTLVNTNYITKAVYFLPQTSTYSESRQEAQDLFNGIDMTYKEICYPEWATVKDTNTGKRVKMPSVYFNAYTIPNNWLTRKGKPFAGDACSWTGFIPGTVLPYTNHDDQYISNHNSRLNTMYENGLGKATPYEQLTMQSGTSELSEINNTYTLTEMIRIALATARGFRWNDLGNTELSEFARALGDEFALKLNGCYKNVTITPQAESSNGAGKQRIRCRIEVSFKTILKGVSFEFYIV